jgi:hypothetical protein
VVGARALVPLGSSQCGIRNMAPPVTPSLLHRQAGDAGASSRARALVPLASSCCETRARRSIAPLAHCLSVCAGEDWGFGLPRPARRKGDLLGKAVVTKTWS